VYLNVLSHPDHDKSKFVGVRASVDCQNNTGNTPIMPTRTGYLCNILHN
jgi:hypothetical protein